MVDVLCLGLFPGPPLREGQCLLDLFCSFNELHWNAVSPTCLGEGGAILLLPHVGLLVTLPGLCGQLVQSAQAHLLYNFLCNSDPMLQRV